MWLSSFMASFFLINSFAQQNYIKHLLGTKSDNINFKKKLKKRICSIIANECPSSDRDK